MKFVVKTNLIIANCRLILVIDINPYLYQHHPLWFIVEYENVARHHKREKEYHVELTLY